MSAQGLIYRERAEKSETVNEAKYSMGSRKEA
jgi:hypothetical protein